MVNNLVAVQTTYIIVHWRCAWYNSGDYSRITLTNDESGGDVLPYRLHYAMPPKHTSIRLGGPGPCSPRILAETLSEPYVVV